MALYSEVTLLAHLMGCEACLCPPHLEWLQQCLYASALITAACHRTTVGSNCATAGSHWQLEGDDVVRALSRRLLLSS